MNDHGLKLGGAALVLVTLLTCPAWAQYPPPQYAQPAPYAPSAPAPAPPAYPSVAPPAYPPPYAYPYAYRPAPEPPQTPKYLPYHEGEAVPQGYYLEDSVRRGPVIAGSIVFGVPYAISLSIAGGNGFDNQTGWLALPVVGPWVELAARHSSCSQTSNDTVACDEGEDTSVRTGLVMDGLMQVTGAVLFIWGVTSHTQRLVRDDVASVEIVPTTVGSGYGLGAVGRF
jgi:hypothetical protein